MIAVSGLLVVIAFVSLILGIFQSGLSLIYVSIASSVLAAVSLATGVVKTRPKTVSVGAGEALGTWGQTTATPVGTEETEEEAPAREDIGAYEAPAVTQVLTLDQDEEPAEVIDEAPAPRAAARKTPARKTAAKSTAKTAAAKTAAKATGAAKTAAAAGKVVVIPDRDKFHKSSCRYAQGEATQSMTKAAAKKAGYVACGVCKP
ncbi:MAG: hypothetical protein ABR548_05995 [Actinomycetota bacterium]|nr:hypothetical protein [Actinomycetota bacterium]